MLIDQIRQYSLVLFFGATAVLSLLAAIRLLRCNRNSATIAISVGVVMAVLSPLVEKSVWVLMAPSGSISNIGQYQENLLGASRTIAEFMNGAACLFLVYSLLVLGKFIGRTENGAGQKEPPPND